MYNNNNEIDCYYRVTGPQSIARITPLLPLLSSSIKWQLIDNNCIKDNITLSLVWETTCEKTWRDNHNNAVVLNKMHNTIIIENKSNTITINNDNITNSTIINNR